MKSYVISVSFGIGCYRHIQISASATLYKLHKAILSAFDFVDDHSHAFFMDNHIWMPDHAYFSDKMESGDRLTKSYKLEHFHLQKGDKFRYVFDFGESWEFQCKVLREVEVETNNPIILRRVGDDPEQYPVGAGNWDDQDQIEDLTDVDDGFPEFYPKNVCQKLYDKLPLPKPTITHIHEYVQAAARVYGILSVEALFEIYNNQNTPLPQEDFLSVIEIIRHEVPVHFAILGLEALYEDAPVSLPMHREIVAQYLWFDDLEDYYKLTNQQTGKPLKILPQKEFLRYADPDYYPATPQSMAMKTYLYSRASSLKDDPESMWLGLQDMITMDFRLQEIINYLEPEGLVFDSKHDIGEFFSLYQALNNHTRKHANLGHTLDELFSMTACGQQLALRNAPENQISLFEEPVQKPQLSLVSKPARNGPCPCGSGRKYKNCCGKSK